jgi:hypothetical protein
MLAALISAWISTVLNYYQTKFGKDSRLSQVEKVSPTRMQNFLFVDTYEFR